MGINEEIFHGEEKYKKATLESCMRNIQRLRDEKRKEKKEEKAIASTGKSKEK